MDYRVEELAVAAGVGVDTLRFYQGRGLLPAPRRVGRVAYYGDPHLERLRRIRDLQRQGFSLAQIRKVVTQPDPRAESEPLLAALVEERVGERSLTRAELAAESGVAEALIQAAVSAGLMEPLGGEGEERFSEADLEMARLGLTLLESGFPLQELLTQAMGHVRHVQGLCDAAIDLFDDHVRKAEATRNDVQAITDAFRKLLPLVTRLVAVHFQRTLVARALNRLEGKKELDALEAAVRATEAARLEVEVAWR